MVAIRFCEMALFTDVQYLYTFNIVAPSFITFFQMFGRCLKPSALPSLLMFRIDTFFSCVVQGPLQWFFHFDEEIAIAWTHVG